MIQQDLLSLDSSLTSVYINVSTDSSIWGYVHTNASWFCPFLQVVYADNVHFGLVSQKLSSVAYKG